MRTCLLWLRRDLRLRDHPGLLAAAAHADQVVPLFVLDPALWRPAGAPRRSWLARSLAAWDGAAAGALVVRRGDPAAVLPALAAELDATCVHVSADTGPYGRRRDAAVARALGAGRPLVAAGTPYAIGPGTLSTAGGRPFTVFSSFARAWAEHGWPAPAGSPTGVRWARGVPSDGLPEPPATPGLELGEVGEAAAHRRWQHFLDDGLAGYARDRNDAAADATSRMSAHLKYGEIHPRTMLADLAGRTDPGAQRYRDELCWREFYADVLWHRPDSARGHYRPELARMPHEPPGEAFAAWQQGRTGFPFVDAGMRQLRAEGWMHNRVRMVVASFCVKDLHVQWQHGARHFMRWLKDGDLASNQHGWQWVAGSGTDAAPYVRVLNPVTQGQKFDPDGDYVRRWVPELRHLPGSSVHEPWAVPNGYAHGYPERLLDHAVERVEALARYQEARDA